MRQSKALIPTLKEAPGDAVVASHILMARAGMIRRLAAGVYNFLPLGLRVLQKLERIVREEMERAGGQELRMPCAIPAELWQQSGRWDAFGPELLRFEDRKGTAFCFGPTHEEVVTDLVRREVRSYRELPLCLFQIQTKFRDELRPRFGVMRVREFAMKDAYSFDVDADAARASYQVMYEAYHRIFSRCGLRFRAVLADTGTIGGSLSHEFQVLADSGEDSILACADCGHAANVELCAIKSPDPGSTNANANANADNGAPYEAIETPGRRTIDEVSDFLGTPAERMVKTLVYVADGEPVAALLRGDHELAEAKLRKALGASAVETADEATVREVTGAPVGFAGPVGLGGVRTFGDHAVRHVADAVTGANRADTHLIHVQPGRDFEPTAWADLRAARDGDLCPECGAGLEAHRGIEVGHVFQLGDKYSLAMGCEYRDAEGHSQPMQMGCYGIGIARTAASAIEQHHDQDGIIWPAALAPYQVHLLWLQAKDAVIAAAEGLYDALQQAGVEVLLDDRDERAGLKFKDADLIGCPIRIAVGSRGVARGVAEIKLRSEDVVFEVAFCEVVDWVQEALVRLLAPV
ncbi:MAG: proline--tRNA ligase [Myxococcales bacterium]|nr:proline--tRNA ligase [Myxococcales bacterium]